MGNGDTVENPYYDAMAEMTGETPPEFCKGIFNTNELDDILLQELQDWCCSNSKLSWTTGIGLLEAVDHIVECAIENGNIKDKDDF